jgi:ubiquinone/menaquinone biosynthesis C-methylase UbiE
MTFNATAHHTSYPLGHDPRELDRLTLQARLFEPITRRFFEAAGLQPGMRVLDIGSGAGDVAFLARTIVGEGGEVVGIDRAPEAVATANARAMALGYYNVRFVQTDIMDCLPDPQFDAVIGRLVLMYARDAAAALRQLTERLRPGTLVAFLEFDMQIARAAPATPAADRTLDLIRTALESAGAECQMGLKLPTLYESVGLPAPQLRYESMVAATAGHPAFQLVAEVFRTLLPVVERFDPASAREIDVDTLAGRIEAEVLARNGVLVAPALVGAWTRTR